ncbi:MAG: SDR family oxidoreductase [Candidatus Gastranaerophilaceae bacterium]|jgi:NAD(P)-dependent dehydrogenase (short-subunit alcohol dehydrogenase family)
MKNVLITGSSKGIGASIAQKLADQSYNVFLTGRNSQRLFDLQKKINVKGFLAGNLLEEGFCEQLCKTAKATMGSIDVLINNAGDYYWSPVEKTDKQYLERLLKLNLQVPYELCSLVAEDMKKNKFGRIVNIGSISGSIGEANASLYSTTKSGLIGMTKALAIELAEYSITVNIINPGWVNTELAQECFEKGIFDKQEQLDATPQKRFIEPEEIAFLVEYIVSDKAKGLTGQSLNLCAGLSLGVI